MPAFHYIALNQEQRKLPGIIEAIDEQTAQKKLNELGLSVISLSLTDTAPHKAESAVGREVRTFNFEAIDKNGKKVTGTIKAESGLSAYVRLFEEYQLNVISLAPANPTDAENEIGSGEFLTSLREEYSAAKGIQKQKLEKEQAVQIANAQEKNELLQKIDSTIERVKTFIGAYAKDLKPEERDFIQSSIDQLVRIKDSTNLEHIRTTCTRMLDHIQKQELFMHEQERLRESARLKLETRDLLDQLKQKGIKKDIDFMKMLEEWGQSGFLKPMSVFLLKIFSPASPEIAKCNAEIKVVSSHIRSYLKTLILGPSRMMRLEAWESIKTLRQEKKRLIMQRAAARESAKALDASKHEEGSFFLSLAEVAGWLLAFYLIVYFISYLFTIKQFGLTSLPASFYFYTTHFTKGATLFLFILYGALTLRIHWFRSSTAASLLLIPMSIFAFLLIMVNLM